MAKNQNSEQTENTESMTDASKIVPPETAGSADGRSIILEIKQPDGSVAKVRRTDYIRQRWADKASRSKIAAELSEIQNKKVPYQVVFAATKGLPGGPDKEAAAPATEGASAEATE